MTSAEPVRVVFRVFRDGGDILALFPEVKKGACFCLSYQRLGQHGAADYGGCIAISRSAKPEEYAGLQCELERLGYSLQVRKRRTRSKGGDR